MTARRSIRRHRSAISALAVACTLALVGGPASALMDRPSAPTQEGEGSQLKAEYDEIIGQEVEKLRELAAAQEERRKAADALAQLEQDTTAKQVELLAATDELQRSERALEAKVAERKEAEREVWSVRDRLRKQIVAAYVTGGDQGGTLEALVKASSGEEIGQALAYGRAASASTDTLVEELEAAEAEKVRAARSARAAQRRAEDSRDEIAAAAEFLVAARQQQADLLSVLNAQVLIEADALRQVQGRKALVEGRITSMNRTSDGVAMILAQLQADQPDWIPGAVEITTPLPGVEVSSKFGMRHHPILGIDRLHAGADLGAPTGTELHAAADGTVVIAEERGGYGLTVVIDHGSSLATLYGHNSRLLVEAGDEVRRGDVIALVGSTGLSTGPHSHFETRIKGMPIDPESVIDFSFDPDYEALALSRGD